MNKAVKLVVVVLHALNLFSMRFIILLLSLHFFTFSNAQVLQFSKVEGLFFTSPVDMEATGIDDDTRVFVLEKNGRIYIIDDLNEESPTTLSTAFLNISNQVDPGFEGGLLGLAFDPNYEQNGYFYLNYTMQDPDNGGQFSTRVSRFSVMSDNENMADPSSELAIITIPQPAKNHNGGDLAFGPDGYLYIPLGDGGGAGDTYGHGQNRQSLLGAVLRIDVSTDPYSIPADNPFAFDDQTLDEIWSIGWRNPWKMSFDSETGDFWAADVGQNAIEELDMEPAGSVGGLNYGWPCYEGTQEYNSQACPDGIIQTEPIFEYDQSLGWKSITGGYVYRGTKHPDLIGKYIFTDYEDSRVFWLTSQDNPGEFTTQRYDFTGQGLPSKVATFGQANDGELYFATLIEGEIWRIFTDEVISTEKGEIKDLSIVPNPVNNYVELETTGQIGKQVVIFDMAGKEILTVNYDGKAIDVSGLQTGNYFLQVSINGLSVRKKFVKR